MKVFKSETEDFALTYCFGCHLKKAVSWSGHVHSDINFKRIATAGWCKDKCDLKIKSFKCSMFDDGCYGSTRLRGFKPFSEKYK